MEYRISQIAQIYTGFKEKFGIPRQAGVAADLPGKIIFEPEYRNPDMLKGLEEFSHIWLLWAFSKNLDEDGKSRWTPTVRPPRLGGNERMGVFATRSPFRPNPIGISVVRLEKIEIKAGSGPVLYVRGADMADKTPIFDIKPYIPYADSVPEAKGGFTDTHQFRTLKVLWKENKKALPEETVRNLEAILSNDPRPHYQNDPDRRYGMSYAGYEIGFKVAGDVLTVEEIIPADRI